ncbi:hypothetical protein IW261DRAFT_1563257 [Armillaria novae-zelandiae]|uniref:Uncharacterized protein n=1 Tax=Armillaria novae-zelandiae TaxID=153914 RepID=A0AA39UFR1_9AGAR|nr:hypothetical protein IW261DRAFT_1563257 [Armillaria novae-zelandiae]
MGAFSTCKWDGTVQFTKSGPILPEKCTVNVGGVIAMIFGILAGLLLLIIIGLHFRQRRTGGPRDVSLTDEEELEQLLPPDPEDQSSLPLPSVPPKDKGFTEGASLVEDPSGYGGKSNEPPPPYIRE